MSIAWPAPEEYTYDEILKYPCYEMEDSFVPMMIQRFWNELRTATDKGRTELLREEHRFPAYVITYYVPNKVDLDTDIFVKVIDKDCIWIKVFKSGKPIMVIQVPVLALAVLKRGAPAIRVSMFDDSIDQEQSEPFARDIVLLVLATNKYQDEVIND